MAEIEAAVQQQLTVLRASYFSRRELPERRRRFGDMPLEPERLREPTVEDAEHAFAQFRLLTYYAALLPRPWTGDYGVRGQVLLGEERLEQSPRLRAVSTGSLTIVVELTPWLLAGGPIGLLTLAYGICTFGPRVSAKRQQLLLEALRRGRSASVWNWKPPRHP